MTLVEYWARHGFTYEFPGYMSLPVKPNFEITVGVDHEAFDVNLSLNEHGQIDNPPSRKITVDLMRDGICLSTHPWYTADMAFLFTQVLQKEVKDGKYPSS